MEWNESSLQEKYPALYGAAKRFARRIRDKKLRDMFVRCSMNTLATTVRETDTDVYLITGDIDAMWLRDSSAQVLQYLELAPASAETARIVKGLVARQCYYICCDPYANAFNFAPNGAGHREDECESSPIVFERKFELDSLCYPVFLSARYYRYTGDATVFTDGYFEAMRKVLDVFETERDHSKSEYYHYRPTEHPSLSVPNRGRGGACGYTGMVWAGYRPSDDPCAYGYNIPGNAFVVTAMRSLAEIALACGKEDIAKRAAAIADCVREGIEKYGIVNHEKYGRIYAYETDGLGNYNLMDDANVPNLLGLPYIGWCDPTDEIYRNTRRFCLSKDNPYYYEGKRLSGLGSPHTPEKYVWHIALAMQGITSTDEAEINGLLATLADTTAGTGYMHEGVCADDDTVYTRSWFAWANSLFAYFMIVKADSIKKIDTKNSGEE
ncbi:MAG: glycoside hydrolase family 125 protein [Clostridiales bacterium]|nr:glycoside hydrolase family 125 protein [Clostridiales bacterium]